MIFLINSVLFFFIIYLNLNIIITAATTKKQRPQRNTKILLQST